MQIAGKIHAKVKGETKHPKAGNEVLGEHIDDIAAFFADKAAKAG